MSETYSQRISRERRESQDVREQIDKRIAGMERRRSHGLLDTLRHVEGRRIVATIGEPDTDAGDLPNYDSRSALILFDDGRGLLLTMEGGFSGSEVTAPDPPTVTYELLSPRALPTGKETAES